MPRGIYIRTKELPMKTRKQRSERMLGEKNHQWRGGKMKSNGYIMIYVGIRKYKMEHRIIMEKYLGRKLRTNEQIHHKNGIKDDNRIKNLKVVLQKTHWGKVKCPKCNFRFEIK